MTASVAPLAILDNAWLRAQVTPGAFRYAAHLATFADSEGLTFVSRRRSAHDLGVSERTVSRHRAELEAAGIIAREDGGWRTLCTRIRLLTRHTKDAARRALAAVQAARRERVAARRHGLSRRGRKGDTVGTRTTPPLGGGGEGGAARALPLYVDHAFTPDESGLSCRGCPLPPSRHRS